MSDLMSDRELLELAARAAGIEIVPCTCRYEQWPFKYAEGQGKRGHWNPLADDGDALRLAVALRMEVYHGWDDGHSAYVSVPQESSRPMFCVEPHMNDPYAATRRAIVRAAAAIAESAGRMHGIGE